MKALQRKKKEEEEEKRKEVAKQQEEMHEAKIAAQRQGQPRPAAH